MIEILIALVFFVTLSLWTDHEGFATLGLIGISIYAAFFWVYSAAEYKADIINKEFGTQYTQEQVFYASDVIDEIRELKRERIEINGDLMTEKNP